MQPMTPKPTPPPPPPEHPLKKLRLKARLRLEDVAALCDTDRSQPCRWESGEREPKPHQRHAYAKALGIDLAKLGALIYVGRVEKAK